MQATNAKTKTIGFITLGCSKNLVDSQVMAGYLKRANLTFARAPEVADIIIINTCAFIEPAREEAAEVILSACQHKQEGGCQAVIVTGCMVQRYRQQLQKAFPEVDGFLGLDELEEVVPLVQRAIQGQRSGVTITQPLPGKLYNPLYPTLLFSGGPFAYLKVADGCNHRCAYCAIPQIRGHFRSRTSESLLQEARDLISAGAREINLISQDTLNYGYDQTQTLQLSTLLQQLDSLEGDFWLRILYGYPANLNDALLELLNTSHHICRYLDLPIQHSHPDILQAMNRGKAIATTTDLPQRLRQAIPGVTLRTTCLVGFPGETEAHFQHLLAYVQEAQFDHLGVFGYSPEEGTAAWDLDDEVAPEVIDQRCQRLMQVQQKLVSRRAARLVDQVERALLLKQMPRQRWQARLASQAPEVDGVTHITGVSPAARPGDFIEVRITGAHQTYDLKARAT